MIGSELEEVGWRQGSVVSTSDIQQLIDIIGSISFADDLVLLVASQSFDIANNNLGTDPYIEFSVARKIDLTKGNLNHNKNPRIHHTNVTCRTSDGDVFAEENAPTREPRSGARTHPRNRWRCSIMHASFGRRFG